MGSVGTHHLLNRIRTVRISCEAIIWRSTFPSLGDRVLLGCLQRRSRHRESMFKRHDLPNLPIIGRFITWRQRERPCDVAGRQAVTPGG